MSMTTFYKTHRALGALLVLCAGGCGEDPADTFAVDGGGGARDGSPSPSTDAAQHPRDGSGDARQTPIESGTGLPDRNEFDCPMVDQEDVLELAAAHEDRSVLAMEVDGNTLHLVYTTPECDGNASRGQGLGYLKLESAGKLPDAEALANADVCRTTQAPAVLVHRDSGDPGDEDDTAIHAYYAGTAGSGLELYEHALAPKPAEPDSGDLLTRDDEDAREFEYLTDAASLSGAGVLAWAYEVPARKAWGIRMMQPLGAARPVQLVDEDEGAEPVAVAISALHQGGAGGVLAWADRGEGRRGIHLQSLNEYGVADGKPQSIDGSVGGGADVSIAARPDNAAVVYTTGANSDQIRMQRLDADGRKFLEPIAITHGNEIATDAVVAAFSSGYVIAYRAVDGSGTGAPTIRLTFVDSGGNIAGSRNVAEAGPSGGQIQLEVANDGRIFLAWPDTSDEARVIRVLRVACDS